MEKMFLSGLCFRTLVEDICIKIRGLVIIIITPLYDYPSRVSPERSRGASAIGTDVSPLIFFVRRVSRVPCPRCIFIYHRRRARPGKEGNLRGRPERSCVFFIGAFVIRVRSRPRARSLRNTTRRRHQSIRIPPFLPCALDKQRA